MKYTYKGFIHFLFDTGNFQEITKLADKLSKQFAQDPDVQFIFARAYAQTGQTEKADALLISLNNQFPTHPDILLHTVDVYSRRKELENALHSINTLLNKSPGKIHYYIFHFLKAQLYTQLNRYDDALKSLQECINKQPRFDKAWLLLAVIQEQKGKLTEAIQGFTTYLETTADTNQQQIEQHLVQLILKQKSLEQHTNTLQLNKSCFENALLLFERKQYKLALRQIDTCIAYNAYDPQSKLLKIEILTAMHDYQAAIDHLKQWIIQKPDELGWIKTLYLLSHHIQAYEFVIQALHSLHARFPHNITIALYLADLHLRSQDKTQAIPYLHAAVHLTQDPQLKTKILFQLSACYYEQKNYTKMSDILEQAHTINAQFPPVLNALAYYYAKDNNITKAEQFITQVLLNHPYNPHFLDTRAYIFYKQKKYQQALEILYPIAEQYPHDCIIQIHTAKTYCKLGNMKAAREQLTKAHMVAKTKNEQATIKKLITLWNQPQ
jgi:predicted Zn-dependent protease